ncbi:longitudinals lacking protein, isoforms A/B/D/L-like [Frankliniella occidentalis]|uniref:Longitudinals lacking protein, isoforms A/B/D/L-like n=1 Tax=Frankliniella occidentalis TaxID=133901 RepID=A0A6J1TF28_FRAOC|nr:longitudinals lacking protein, isoforms A/B/D/L-like [Frankliniella occidentalis]XP_052132509.1 longitudinals lacking protein, isoforms A/B/D/L-like [Frankliniella occidentalis]
MRAVYRCRQCGKTYCWKKTLQRHMKLECGGKEPQFPCPVCQYRFKYKSHRLRHMTKVHHVTHDEAQAVIDNMKSEYGDMDIEGVDIDVDVDVDVDPEDYVMGSLPPMAPPQATPAAPPPRRARRSSVAVAAREDEG